MNWPFNKTECHFYQDKTYTVLYNKKQTQTLSTNCILRVSSAL